MKHLSDNALLLRELIAYEYARKAPQGSSGRLGNRWAELADEVDRRGLISYRYYG